MKRLLSRIPGSGGMRQIFQCEAGCAHLTFDSVTLNFANLSGLRQLAATFRRDVVPLLDRGEDQKVQVCYQRVHLWLTVAEAREMARLLDDMEFCLLDVPTFYVADPTDTELSARPANGEGW